MVREYRENNTSAKFIMHYGDKNLAGKGIGSEDKAPINTFVFNNGPAQKVLIDEVSYELPTNCVLPLVSNQHFVFEYPGKLTAWQFNREFYCIVDHDKEVGCAGFLFYGIHHPMFIKLSDKETQEFNHLQEVFSNELLVNDAYQGEMLRTLLKRIIIKATRMAKRQVEEYQLYSDERMDLIRMFSLLVEGNFKNHHDVAFYANALNKSPKTLSNAFLLLKQDAPSVIIRNRIILEAKRFLQYTDLTAKEIAFELGFESPAHFSRFFKAYSGQNVSEFRI